MTKFYLASALLLAVSAMPAQAKPTTKASAAQKDKVIFACTTAQQKQVLVTEQHNRYRYQFGRAGRPELIFADDKKAAIARSPLWAGIGRSIWSNLVLQNGDYFYTLYTSTDRLTDEHDTEEGITVTHSKGTKSSSKNYDDSVYVAQLICNPNKPMVVNLPDEVMF